MNKHHFFKLLVATILASLLLQNLQASKNIKEVKDKPIKVEKIRFFISAARGGGGWDKKARALGKVIKKLGLVKSVKYENIFYENPKKDQKLMQFKGVYQLIENASQNGDAMLLFSNNILLKFLQGASKYSFKDMTPIASLMKAYRIFVVRGNSPYSSWGKFLKAYKLGVKNQKLMPKIGGWGNTGSNSYISLAKALDASKNDITYMYYNSFAGSKLKKALDNGQVDIISVPINGDLIKEHKEGKIKIIAITSQKDLYIKGLKEPIPSLKQTYGLDVIYETWNGLFSPPNLDPKLAKAYTKIIKKALNSNEWKKIAKKNHWMTFYKPRMRFGKFLESQSKKFKDIIKKIEGV